MPLKRLAYKNGFGQRHWEVRGVSPYLKGLNLEADINLHRSKVNIDLIRDDLMKFSNSQTFTEDFDFKLALVSTRHAFKLDSLQSMLHLNDVFDYDLPIWSSSPGLPWRDMNYKTKRDVIRDPENRKNIRWFWHRVKNSQPVYTNDCLAFVRSHLAEPGKEKVRAVWGYPLTMTLGEAVFAVPLIEAYRKKIGSPIAYGYEAANGGMQRLRSEANHFHWFAGADFKDFDKTVHATLIDYAFEILEQNIDFVHYRNYGTADARRNYRSWRLIRDYFVKTPIRMSNGERYLKDTGVASGSYFTQLVDSVVNHLILTWAFIRQHGRAPQYLRVLGDDSIVADDERFDLDDLDDLVSSFGMKLNMTKSIVTRNLEHVKFLGFQVNFGLPSKPRTEWLAALLIPEHPDRTWDDVASRALGLLYANCGVDGYFDSLCRNLVNLQPFDLKLSRPMVRMLRVMGHEYVDKEPPEALTFMRRLKIW